MKLEKKMYINNFPFFILYFSFSQFSSGTSVHISRNLSGGGGLNGGLKLFYVSGGGHPLGPENHPDIHDFTIQEGGGTEPPRPPHTDREMLGLGVCNANTPPLAHLFAP